MTILQGRSEVTESEGEAKTMNMQTSTSIKYEAWYLGVWRRNDASGALSAKVMYEIGSREETLTMKGEKYSESRPGGGKGRGCLKSFTEIASIKCAQGRLSHIPAFILRWYKWRNCSMFFTRGKNNDSFFLSPL